MSRATSSEPLGARETVRPPLIGAWFIHAMSALGMQILALALIRAIGSLCGRISRPLIGS